MREDDLNFEPRDLERVMQLWLEGNLDAHGFVSVDYWTSNAPVVRELLVQAELTVCELDGVIQGFVGMQDDYLAGIFVDKTYRSAGVGKQLLDHVKKTHPAFSLNVYQRNERAVAFYLREGLSVVEESVDPDTGETDCTMAWGGTSAALSLKMLREHPELTDRAALWFSSKWDIPAEAYRESIQSCIAQKAGVPQWYVMLDEEQKIIAGAGVIENDFHDRKDLSPNLCALFVEEPYRDQGIARSLLDFVKRDMGKMGVQKLYLVTDHTEFYEKCGWSFLTRVNDEDGCPERMYVAECGEK